MWSEWTLAEQEPRPKPQPQPQYIGLIDSGSVRTMYGCIDIMCTTRHGMRTGRLSTVNSSRTEPGVVAGSGRGAGLRHAGHQSW